MRKIEIVNLRECIIIINNQQSTMTFEFHYFNYLKEKNAQIKFIPFNFRNEEI